MTDDTTDETIDTDQAHEDPEPGTDDGEGNPSREAAAYRTRLRETEAERDALAAQLNMMRRTEVERIATAQGVKPDAIWAADVDLDGLLDDAGHVDAAKVEDAIADVQDRFGIVDPRRFGNYDPHEGGTPSPPAADSFTDAFRP